MTNSDVSLPLDGIRQNPLHPVLLHLSAAIGIIVKSGRFWLALPMLIYPVLHFVYPVFVASIVPPWIPWHTFWTYFTAITIFAAGVAIVFKIQARLAATLLGIEIFLFCALIHVFLLFHRPGDPWAGRDMFGDPPSRLVNAFKDFGLSGAVFIFAGTQSEAWRVSGRDNVLTFGRLILAVSIAAFGVLHFVYPVFGPGIPPMLANIPFPIPGHLFWVYSTGLAFLVLAPGLVAGKHAQAIAAVLGLVMLTFDLVTWVPVFAAHPMELTGNWLKDAGIIGGAFILSSSLAAKNVKP